MKKKRGESLTEKEMVDKRAYNWGEMIKLHKQAAESYMDMKKVREAAGAYKKVAYAYGKFAETVDTPAENVEQTRNAIQAYRQAAALYKRIGNKQEELECIGEVFFFNGFVAESNMKCKETFSESHDHFIKSSELFPRRTIKRVERGL